MLAERPGSAAYSTTGVRRPGSRYHWLTVTCAVVHSRRREQVVHSFRDWRFRPEQGCPTAWHVGYAPGASGEWPLGDTRGQWTTHRVVAPTICRSLPVRSMRLLNVEEVALMAVQSVDVLTADEAAQYLRVSRKTLYRLVSAGKIPGQKVGRSWRFRRANLVAFLGAEK